jgi:hypothetical protein
MTEAYRASWANFTPINISEELEDAMAVRKMHELCKDCLNKDTCDYIPSEGNLIRCLDKRTSENPAPETGSCEDEES